MPWNGNRLTGIGAGQAGSETNEQCAERLPDAHPLLLLATFTNGLPAYLASLAFASCSAKQVLPVIFGNPLRRIRRDVHPGPPFLVHSRVRLLGE